MLVEVVIYPYLSSDLSLIRTPSTCLPATEPGLLNGSFSRHFFAILWCFRHQSSSCTRGSFNRGSGTHSSKNYNEPKILVIALATPPTLCVVFLLAVSPARLGSVPTSAISVPARRRDLDWARLCVWSDWSTAFRLPPLLQGTTFAICRVRLNWSR